MQAKILGYGGHKVVKGKKTAEQVTDFPLRTPLPDWSPDGLTIAFSSPGPGGSDWQLQLGWIVSRDSAGLPWSDPVPLTDFDCIWPDWAPDGSSVLCSAGDEGVLVARDGAVLARYDGATAGLVDFRMAQFSPEGSRIYFSATHQDCSEGLWWVPTEGGNATKVVSFDDPSLTVRLGQFRTAGDSFYFSISEYESDVYVMDLEW